MCTYPHRDIHGWLPEEPLQPCPRRAHHADSGSQSRPYSLEVILKTVQCLTVPGGEEGWVLVLWQVLLIWGINNGNTSDWLSCDGDLYAFEETWTASDHENTGCQVTVVFCF